MQETRAAHTEVTLAVGHFGSRVALSGVAAADSPFSPPTHTMSEIAVAGQVAAYSDAQPEEMVWLFVLQVFVAGVLVGATAVGVVWCSCACKRSRATASPWAAPPPPPVAFAEATSQSKAPSWDVATQSQTTYKWKASKPHFHALMESAHGAWVQRTKED